jgi:hypothetical protein
VFKQPIVNPEEVNRFLSMVDSLANTEDEYLLSLIEVAILEILTDSKALQETSFAHLAGNALRMYTSLFNRKFLKPV